MAVPGVEEMGALMLGCLQAAVDRMDVDIRPAVVCYRVGEVAYDADQYVDMCCQGLAYVSLGDIWPTSQSFPEADINRQSTAVCAPPAWGVQWKAGIVRCAPMGVNGSMPTCAEWTSAYLKAVADAQALRETSCCFRSGWRELDDGMSVVIERQVQGSPQGGCVERSVNIAVQMMNCDCVGQP